MHTLGPAGIHPVQLPVDLLCQPVAGHQVCIGQRGIPFVAISRPLAIVVPHHQSSFKRLCVPRKFLNQYSTDGEIPVTVRQNVDLRPVRNGQPTPFFGPVRPELSVDVVGNDAFGNLRGIGRINTPGL